LAKRLTPPAIVALKDALCAIYWYKSDLKSFIHSSVSDAHVVAKLNWDNYKRQIVSDLIDQLCADQDRYVGDLTRLCTEIVQLKSFEHLRRLDGGEEKAKRAEDAVAQLRTLVEPHESVRDEDAAIRERQQKAAHKLRANAAVRAKLDELKQRYLRLAMSPDHQGRGYALERLLYDLFELFDLDPKASFKNTGEQIDGAFSLEGTDYLFEARWREDPSDIGQLDGFAAKVTRKLENTLGVFLAINGFSQEAITAYSKARPSIVLTDGADLMAVLEERIDFVSLLLRKKRHAAQTGNIYLRIHEIL
jgi:hypothetical protein